jgi:hypothetical protein
VHHRGGYSQKAIALPLLRAHWALVVKKVQKGAECRPHE